MPAAWVEDTRFSEVRPLQVPPQWIKITTLRITQPNCARVERKATQQIGGSWLLPRITTHGGMNPLRKSDGGELMRRAKGNGRDDTTTC